MQFQVIVADPPWSFSDRLQKMKAPTKRSAASQYKTMTLSEIQALDVPSLADPNGCILVLWVPSTLLINGLTTLLTWGFALKSTVVWVKTKKKIVNQHDMLAFGMGRLFRASHELALIGTSGKSVYSNLKNRSQRSVILAPNAGHSIKPEALQDSLELMFPNANKLELFARRVRPSWTCLGNQIDERDISDAISKLTTPSVYVENNASSKVVSDDKEIIE